MYKENILDCIGNTPLVKLNKIIKKYNLSFNLFAKVERFNPSGSIKCKTVPVATQVLPIFPVFAGISGSYNTTFNFAILFFSPLR